MSGFGVYVHVPFCSALCPYCDFAVVVGKRHLHEQYCEALKKEAATCLEMPEATSMFIGGGTPTFIEPSLLARAIKEIQDMVPVTSDAEITIEANPESVSKEGLTRLRSGGVNRLSVGAQAFQQHVLEGLGRTHSVDQINEAVAHARAAGFQNVSLDLIYGGPSETREDWMHSLRSALSLDVDHISCYALTIEERTPFGEAVARGRMHEPDQDMLAMKYEAAVGILGDAGFHHYEISNWARPGFESRHNMLYWTQGDYVGLGLGAHSHRDGVRWWNTRSLKDYLEHPQKARAGEEALDPMQRAEEWLSLRLRLVDGLDLSEAGSRLGTDLIPSAHVLERDGLVEIQDMKARLTTRGMLLENEVALRLLSSQPLALDMVEC